MSNHFLVWVTRSGKIWFPLLSLLFLTSYASAQHTLKGQVTDQHQGLPGAVVSLVKPDSSIVHTVTTDSAGGFFFHNIPEGDYKITVRMMGFLTYLSSAFHVENKDIDLPAIPLQEDTALLKEVVIDGERNFLQQEQGKVVMNVANSVTSSGNSVLEILQKSPGVVVNRQNFTISISGRSGVTLMIDGKQKQLTAEALVQMLEGMSAANVDRIEIITTPDSRQDAAGSGGIIHIITNKKETDLGTNASFSLTGGASWAETLGGSFNVQHRTHRMAWFTDYSITRRRNLHRAEYRIQSSANGIPFETTTESYRPNTTTQQNFRGGFELNINKRTQLILDVSAFRRNWEMDAQTDEENSVGSDSVVISKMYLTETNRWQSVATSLSLSRQFKRENHVTFSADYLYYDNHNPSHYKINSSYEHQSGENFELDVTKETPIHFIVGRVDYHHLVGPALSWDAGIKSVYSTLDNNVLVQRNNGVEWTNDPVFSSSASLIEKIHAAYLSWKWLPGKKIEVNGGFRYEFTNTLITSPIEEDRVHRKYGYFIPSFAVNKTFDAEKNLRFSYSRRIMRPGYNDIAPFVLFWGLNTFSSGNTKLYPSISDIISTGYNFKQWSVSLQFTHSRNEIGGFQPEQDAEGNVIYRSQNLKYLNTLSLTNTYSIEPSSWWDVQATVTVQYQVAKSTAPVKRSITLPGCNISLTSRVKFPKNFSFELSALYQSRILLGIVEFLPMGSLNAGVRKNFGKKGSLQLSMDDILYTSAWRLDTKASGNFSNYFSYDWYNQYIRLTYSLNLGNLKVRPSAVSSGVEEERGRVK